MGDSWISIFTYNPADMVNPLYLATEEYDTYPEQIHLISAGPATATAADRVRTLLRELLNYYDTDTEIEIHRVSNQFDLSGTQKQLDSILSSVGQEGAVSLDLTGQPSLLNAFLFYVAAKDDRQYEHIFYCSRDPPRNEADFLLNDLETTYTLHQLRNQ